MSVAQARSSARECVGKCEHARPHAPAAPHDATTSPPVLIAARGVRRTTRSKEGVVGSYRAPRARARSDQVIVPNGARARSRPRGRPRACARDMSVPLRTSIECDVTCGARGCGGRARLRCDTGCSALSRWSRWSRYLGSTALSPSRPSKTFNRLIVQSPKV